MNETQDPQHPADPAIDRRTLLRRLALGTAGIALTSLSPTSSSAKAWSTAKAWGIVKPSPTTPPPLTVRTPPLPSFRQVIDDVVNMPFDSDLVSRASNYGLDVLNLTWEDTGRNVGSSVGPNISDLTLQVREPLGRGNVNTHLLPVLRYPNFTDTTADVQLDDLWIKIGNQHRKSTVMSVPLREVLSNIRSYVSDPLAVVGANSLIANRDTHALVSAQHVFLPLPKEGKAEFTPVIYNYQSSTNNPAVMVLMCTREGTSMAVAENWSGDQSYQQWGQQLYFNDQGRQTTFTGERKSAVKARVESGRAKKSDAGALDEGSDMVMIIQVPLVHRQPRYDEPPLYPNVAADKSLEQAAPAAPAPAGAVARRSDVEQAVLGHGEKLGPVREFNGQRLERDTTFPIRVTVQFYRATSNGVVSNEDLAAVKADIDQVYRSGDYVGSLVVPQGDRSRPTEWTRARSPYKSR